MYFKEFDMYHIFLMITHILLKCKTTVVMGFKKGVNVFLLELMICYIFECYVSFCDIHTTHTHTHTYIFIIHYGMTPCDQLLVSYIVFDMLNG